MTSLFVVCGGTGEKLSDDEVDQLIQGVEDSQGNINYEGELSALPAAPEMDVCV